MIRLQRMLRIATAFSWLPFAAIVIVALAKGLVGTAILTTIAGILWLIRLGDIFNIYELP